MERATYFYRIAKALEFWSASKYDGVLIALIKGKTCGYPKEECI